MPTPAISNDRSHSSNLQPRGYERAELAGKASDCWYFRAGSAMFVRVWLRGFIGYLSVEPNPPRKSARGSHWTRCLTTQSMANRSPAKNSLLTGKFTKSGTNYTRPQASCAVNYGLFTLIAYSVEQGISREQTGKIVLKTGNLSFTRRRTSFAANIAEAHK
jgi:hypothetical protein